jgi:hypothetical protein
VAWDLDSTEVFDTVSEQVTVQQVRCARWSMSPQTWAGTVTASRSTPAGFDELYLHQVGQSQNRFIDAFGEHVLPAPKEV